MNKIDVFYFLLIAALGAGFVYTELKKRNFQLKRTKKNLYSETGGDTLESLLEHMRTIDSKLKNLTYPTDLKEPYRTRVYVAMKYSYEDDITETKAKIVEVLGLEKRTEAKIVGWVVADQDGNIWRWYDKLRKEDTHWTRSLVESLTDEQAIEICGRVPLWSDNEPTPIYE